MMGERVGFLGGIGFAMVEELQYVRANWDIELCRGFRVLSVFLFFFFFFFFFGGVEFGGGGRWRIAKDSRRRREMGFKHSLERFELSFGQFFPVFFC